MILLVERRSLDLFGGLEECVLSLAGDASFGNLAIAEVVTDVLQRAGGRCGQRAMLNIEKTLTNIPQPSEEHETYTGRVLREHNGVLESLCSLVCAERTSA